MSDMPVSFIRKGIQYDNAAVRNSQDMSQLLEIGDVDQKIEYQLFVRRSLLPETPAQGERWQVQEKTGWSHMRVVRVKPSPDNGQLITCDMGYDRTGGVLPS